MSEKDALAPRRPEPPPQSTIPDQALYHDSTQTPRARCMQILFVGLVVIMVLVTIVLSIVQGIKQGSYGGIYFMLGLALLGFVAIEIILIIFIRRDHLGQEKMWFLYFVGGIVILEAIFTDVLSIVQGIKQGSYGGIYFMLGLALLGFVAIEIILIIFIRRDHLGQEKMWFLYFVGGIVILEAIFTDVLLFE